MSKYKKFAFVYDDVMGDRQEAAQYVHKLLKANHPKAKSLLELGCGTGSLLSHLSKLYLSTGIDNSPEMLLQAKKKAAKVRFLLGDITKFKLEEKFDTIICVFDTINHITSIKKWEMIFSRVAKNLSPDGIFIFDINTVAKIKRYSGELPYAMEGKNSSCIVKVSEMKGCNYFLDITAFSQIKGDNFKRFKAIIPEVTFDQKVVLSLLKKYFGRILLKDPDRPKVSKLTEELYFVCSKPK
jgi:SAM-dependent methyltransferase